MLGNEFHDEKVQSLKDLVEEAAKSLNKKLKRRRQGRMKQA
jgi:hypothetical protein